jgi:hypothetical protein
MPMSMKPVRTATLIAVSVSTSAAHAMCAAPKDMNGIWKANDGGTYYVRQSGNDIWWVGMSADGGKQWTNVFKGVRNGSTITGTWSDVPKGKGRSGGTLNLHVDGSNSLLTRREVTGGFAGSKWSVPCNDTVQQPAGG